MVAKYQKLHLEGGGDRDYSSGFLCHDWCNPFSTLCGLQERLLYLAVRRLNNFFFKDEINCVYYILKILN